MGNRSTPWWWACCAGLGAVAPACSPLANTARTLVVEPLQYCRELDSKKDWKRNRELAEAAWERVCVEGDGAGFSADYADGFVEGYATYLYEGGNGLPPAVPPRRYWDHRYESPAGERAVEDWFAGYRHGAGNARASGLREYFVVHASAPALTGRELEQPIGAGAGAGAGEPPGPDGETLPSPRRQPNAEAGPLAPAPRHPALPARANPGAAADVLPPPDPVPIPPR